MIACNRSSAASPQRDVYKRQDYGCGCYIDTGDDDYYAEEYLEDIKTVAAMYGEDPEVIQELYNDGYTLEELEEMIYTWY